jgi:2-polyprenyl-3-methyl-5-hydroxy-6-metoxy-1,4-benzoquinol methylase
MAKLRGEGTTRSVVDLEFTGERIVPGRTPEPMFREHEIRYLFAGQYVVGKNVVDVACGVGIGTDYLLKAGAKSCIGFDIDAETIEYAEKIYPRCTFVKTDGSATGLPDSSVDVVVSFETIEHVRDQKKFLKECHRILKPGGLLICSTPNHVLSQWADRNPYHVTELTPAEFLELIRLYFEEVNLFSQAERTYLAYALRALVSRVLDADLKALLKRVLRRKPVPIATRKEFIADGHRVNNVIVPYRPSILFQPMYLIAVAIKNK